MRIGGAEDSEIELDLLEHSGSPYLDDDLTPVLEQTGMDLCDRGARERLGLDAGEHLSAELLVDPRRDLLERHRRRVVDELDQLLDVDVRKQVGPRRQQLSELHVGRPQLLESAAELDRGFVGRGPLAADAHLSQDARQLAPACDAGDLQRPVQPLSPRTH